jgi:CRP-like cAMP-binding protein
MEARKGLLRDIYFFRGLTEEDLAKVAAVCREEHFKAGDMICREGSPADRFFIILEGAVEVWKDWGDPEADLLAAHGPGHLFGELALIDELP